MGHKRSITYANIPPGTYAFRVRGSNNDGKWGEKEAQIQLKIEPPIYLRWWFFLGVFGSIIALFFGWDWHHRRNENKLEQLVKERTLSMKKTNLKLEKTALNLKKAQTKLVESAHQAGMAEIASDVLHNIGNALNSLQVSSSMIEKNIQDLRIDFLVKLNALLNHDPHLDMVEFFSSNPKGVMFPSALNQITGKLAQGRENALSELKKFNELIFHINEIVVAQRQYALADNFYEVLDLKSLIEDVFRIQENAFQEFDIRIQRDFSEIPLIKGSKSKLLHIFSHVIKNACDALLKVDIHEGRLIQVRLSRHRKDYVRCEIEDNGVGIPKENLIVIFSHGFTTRETGRGSGLHYCANALNEMGGSIGVKSKGEGLGSTFVLEIPVAPKKKDADKDFRAGYETEQTVKLPPLRQES